MMTGERITRQHVQQRCQNVNRRMEARGSVLRYMVEGRNGQIGLDRFTWRDPADKTRGVDVLSTVTVGTKREVADFLHAMKVALDDAEVKSW